MKRHPIDGRQFAPELSTTARRDGEIVELCSPGVGYFVDAPLPGSLVGPGVVVGQLEVLGVTHRLRAPEDAAGVVLERGGPRLARRAVQWGEVLLRLDPQVGPAAVAQGSGAAASAQHSQGLQFRSPLSGRYYARSGPEAAPFVQVGDVVAVGQTVALLEVMKTFNRVTYGGEGLPDRARVVAVGPRDEDDVDEGDVLLVVEPA